MAKTIGNGSVLVSAWSVACGARQSAHMDTCRGATKFTRATRTAARPPAATRQQLHIYLTTLSTMYGSVCSRGRGRAKGRPAQSRQREPSVSTFYRYRWLLSVSCTAAAHFPLNQPLGFTVVVARRSGAWPGSRSRLVWLWGRNAEGTVLRFCTNATRTQ